MSTKKGNNLFLNGRLTQVEDRTESYEVGNVYNFPATDGATYVAPTDGYIFVSGGVPLVS